MFNFNNFVEILIFDDADALKSAIGNVKSIGTPLTVHDTQVFLFLFQNVLIIVHIGIFVIADGE